MNLALICKLFLNFSIIEGLEENCDKSGSIVNRGDFVGMQTPNCKKTQGLQKEN
jgi:hypothetical protein